MKRAALALPLLVAACATVTPDHRGLEAWNAGDCKTALAHWTRAAAEGSASAMNNLGVIYSKGCPPASVAVNHYTAKLWFTRAAQRDSPMAYANLGDYDRFGHAGGVRNLEAAIANYHYAARWNVPRAIKALQDLKIAVPQPDLYRARQARLAEQRRAEQERTDAAIELFATVLVGLAEGYANSKVAPVMLPTASGVAPPATSIYTPSAGCTSDFACSYGSKCVKPMYQSTGVCLQAVNSAGTPTWQAPQGSSVGPNVSPTPSCVTTGCPAGFMCDMRLNACVK